MFGFLYMKRCRGFGLSWERDGAVDAAPKATPVGRRLAVDVDGAGADAEQFDILAANDLYPYIA